MNGDKTWLRSRAVVITFEECWPLAASLSIERDISSKLSSILNVTRSEKVKDAAGLGALAHALSEGDRSTERFVPDIRLLKFVAEALKRPPAFFDWAFGQAKDEFSKTVVSTAKKYLPVATWQWDKACILAGALLAISGERPQITDYETPTVEFPFWIALDKHTPIGKIALSDIAKEIGSSYRQLIWASFYCESTSSSYLKASPWWDAEKSWRLNRAGMTLDDTEKLWSRASPLVRARVEPEAKMLKGLVDELPIVREITTPSML
jgi:hypothetical protein